MKRSLFFTRVRCLVLGGLLAVTLLLAACAPAKQPSAATGTIYLYGEQHDIQAIMDREIELWSGYYHDQNMRHLFIEMPYYTAEYMNLWMQADDDQILEMLYENWQGTAVYDPAVKDFYKKIKQDCPQTVFHGTDVGHQYDTIGADYLAYLEQNDQKNTEQYRLAQQNIDQGKKYYADNDDVYRENAMAENFIRVYDEVNTQSNGESIMGIYGSAHTGLDAQDMTGTVPCMAKQLCAHYGQAVKSEDLTALAGEQAQADKATEPERIDTLEAAGKSYQASYFGSQDLTGFRDYTARAFWRIEDAYADFAQCPTNGNVLPYDNYPMQIEVGQVFLTEYTKADGSVERYYFRSDGNDWEGQKTTEEFTLP